MEHVSIWLYVILALNLVISWWNARVCGMCWVESREIGGFIRLVVWCGAIQSAIGFSSVFLFPMIFMAHWAFPLQYTDLYVRGTLNLWYISVIFPALGTGFIIMLYSWIAAYRERDLLSMGTAAYNTLAMAHNTYEMVEGLGPAFKAVGEAFSSVFSDDDEDEKKIGGVVIMVAVVLAALLAGTILTAVLIRHYAGTVPLPARATRRGSAADYAR